MLDLLDLHGPLDYALACEKGDRSPQGTVPSEHPDLSLTAQHSLVIGGQDQRLLPRYRVRG